ncbi:hypothetical protein V1264_013946 [Littorina saxatilis]|uniref:Uncharacterized protein n=2 Tax=Littorina saxatilis TaxID=31220 RepID=A0AAN9BPB5_9CAEN
MEASSMDERSDHEQDNQNTNRSEACAASACVELLSPAGNGLTEIKPAETSDGPLSDKGKMYQIPSIVITAPSENENDEESTQSVTVSTEDTSVEESTMDELIDEETHFNDGKSGVDTASDDEFEVICRCSSTPLSVNNESRSSISSSKGGMSSSIDDTSPIAKREKGDGNDSSRGSGSQAQSPQSPSMMFLQSSYYAHHQGQEIAHDGYSQAQELSDAHIQNTSAYDSSTAPTFSQQIPVYNVNGTTVTYVSGPQNAAAPFPGYQREGGCQVQIPNGFSANYLTGKEQMSDGVQPGETTGHSQGGGEAGFQQQSDMYPFVYPSIYVSNAGLISVLLRHDMSVEMTVDRTIRVVSHQHMMAVATDSRGTSACLYHPALKVIQQGTTTDIASDAVRVHMGHDDVAFAVGHNRYRFDSCDIQPATQVKFSDICKDQSVNLLFSSEGYGESLVPQCLEVASKAEYANLPKGGVIVRINGVKVTQTGNGDVTVVTGAKFIRLSPSFGMTRLGNRFIDIEIERDWSSRVSRGPHCFFAADRRVIISNGKLEVEVNEQGRMKVAHLQPRRSITPQQCLRQSDNFVRRVNSVTYTASSAARAAAIASRVPPARRRSAPVGVSL